MAVLWLDYKSLTDETVSGELAAAEGEKEWEDVWLNSNKLESVPRVRGRRGFNNVKWLHLNSNIIKSVNTEHIPVTVTELVLFNNQLAQMCDFTQFIHIKKLDLSDNKISGPLSGRLLPVGIEVLNIHDNNITHVYQMSHLTRLGELYLHINSIQEVEDLPPHCTEVTLGNNPLVKLNKGCFDKQQQYKAMTDPPVNDFDKRYVLTPASRGYKVLTTDQISSLQSPPPDVFNNGWQAVVDYFKTNDLLEDFKQQIDHTKKMWNQAQKQYLVKTCFLQILMAGETFYGKSSISRSLLLNSPYTTEVHDRTRVLDYWSLKIDDNTSVTLYDLGGHSSYQVLAHLFHSNSEHNLTMIPHEITDDDFSKTCTWITDILTRSPKSQLWLLLTKYDLLSSQDEIQKRKQAFKTFIIKYIRNEIESLHCNFATLSDDSQKSHVTHMIKKYKSVVEQLENEQILHLVSCKHLDDIQKLHSSISDLLKKPNFKSMMLPSVHQLYTRMGQLGVEGDTWRLEALKQKQVQVVGGVKPSQAQAVGGVKPSQARGGLLQRFLMRFGLLEKTKVQATQMCEEPYKKTESTVPEKSASDSNKLHPPADEVVSKDPEHISSLNFVTFSAALKMYREILFENGTLSEASLEEDLKKALRTLSSHGLILWYEGSSNLQNFIFNNIGSFVNMLKSFFVHDLTDFNFENLCEDMKVYIKTQFSEASYKQSIDRLSQQGLMDLSLLQILTSKFDFHHQHEAMVDLLEHLSIAHKANHEKDLYLYFPWYLSDSDSMEIQSLVDTMRISTRDTVSWQICLKGHLPCPFYDAFCVRVYKFLLPHVDTQQRKVWKDLLFASVDDVDILIQHQKKETTADEIKIYVKSPVLESAFYQSWHFIQHCEKAVTHLKKYWWQGFGSNLTFECPACPLHGETCNGSWPLDTITTKTSEPGAKYCCPGKKNWKFPAALIYPLSSDKDVAKQGIRELKMYLNQTYTVSAVQRDHAEYVMNIPQVMPLEEPNPNLVYPIPDSTPHYHQPPRQIQPNQRPQDYYAMTPPGGLGLVIIFVNFTGHLQGYNKDLQTIKEFFLDKLGYLPDNILEFRNLCRRQFIEKLEEVQAILNGTPNIERVYVFILSHGSSEGVLMCQEGSDSLQEGYNGNPVSFEKIIKAFEHDKIPALKNKPKMLFIQTCRGHGALQSAGTSRADVGQSKNSGQNQPAALTHVTIGADILIGYSTLFNYMAWVNTQRGSHYIEALVDEFNRHYREKEITEMLTAVNRILSTKNIGPDQRQMSEFVSRLTGKVLLYKET